MRKVLAGLFMVALLVACNGKPAAPATTPGTSSPVVVPTGPLPPWTPAPALCKDGTHMVITSGTGTTAIKKCFACTGGRWVPEPCPSVSPKPSPTFSSPPVTVPQPKPSPTVWHSPPVTVPPTVCKEGSISAVGGPNGPVCEFCQYGKWVEYPCPAQMKALELKPSEKAVLSPE